MPLRESLLYWRVASCLDDSSCKDWGRQVQVLLPKPTLSRRYSCWCMASSDVLYENGLECGLLREAPHSSKLSQLSHLSCPRINHLKASISSGVFLCATISSLAFFSNSAQKIFHFSVSGQSEIDGFFPFPWGALGASTTGLRFT